MPPSLSWGLEKESIAVDSYVKHLQDGLQMGNCGLIASPQFPWLGCSPDGLVVEGNCAIRAREIKCPNSKKDMIIEDAVANGKKCLHERSEGRANAKEKS